MRILTQLENFDSVRILTQLHQLMNDTSVAARLWLGDSLVAGLLAGGWSRVDVQWLIFLDGHTTPLHNHLSKAYDRTSDGFTFTKLSDDFTLRRGSGTGR